jgi:hypothetical protein
VAFLGVPAGDHGQPHHRVLVDPDQAARLANAAAFLQVLEDGDGFVLGQLAAVQRRAFAFGEASLAAAAGEDAALFVGPVAETDAEVVEAAAAVVGALLVLAAESFQVVHGSSRWPGEGEKVASQLESA